MRLPRCPSAGLPPLSGSFRSVPHETPTSLEQYAGQHAQSHSTRFDIMLGIFLYALNLSVNSAELNSLGDG